MVGNIDQPSYGRLVTQSPLWGPQVAFGAGRELYNCFSTMILHAESPDLQCSGTRPVKVTFGKGHRQSVAGLIRADARLRRPATSDSRPVGGHWGRESDGRPDEGGTWGAPGGREGNCDQGLGGAGALVTRKSGSLPRSEQGVAPTGGWRCSLAYAPSEDARSAKPVLLDSWTLARPNIAELSRRIIQVGR